MFFEAVLDPSIWSAFVVSILMIVASIIYILVFQKKDSEEDKDGV